MFIVYRFWFQFSLASFVIFGIFGLYRFFLVQISKRGQWPSESDANEEVIAGSDYQSFFGDLPGIQASNNGHYLYDLHKELNQPDVYRIWMGPEPALMLAHPRAVKEFWSQHDEKLVERNVNLGWALNMIMGYGVGFRSMADRNRITKYFHHAFGSSQVRHFDCELETIVDEFFRHHSTGSLQSSDIKYLAHDAAIHLFLGCVGMNYVTELHCLVDELAELMTEAFNARWSNVPIIGYYLLPCSYILRQRIIIFRKRVKDTLSKVP